MQTEGATAVRCCYWKHKDPGTAVHPQAHQTLRK